MELIFEYNRAERLWIARYKDQLGFCGPFAFGLTKERAAFFLGAECGKHPEKFSRPLEELLETE